METLKNFGAGLLLAGLYALVGFCMLLVLVGFLEARDWLFFNKPDLAQPFTYVVVALAAILLVWWMGKSVREIP